MKILVADDESASRLALQAMLRERGHEIATASDGQEAWQIFQGEDPPKIALLNWLMPGIDGAEVCRRVRTTEKLRGTYLMLLTSRDAKEHIVEALQAGANDCVIKPFDNNELLARVDVGLHVLQLQAELWQRVSELTEALARVNQLEDLLPICAYCKKVRDDQDYWHRVEQYIQAHLVAKRGHGICPACWSSVVEPQLVEMERGM